MILKKLRLAIAALVLAAGLGSSAASQTTYTYKILHSFSGGADGESPQGPLWRDTNGNLYGMTYNGGGSSVCPAGCGTVYEVSPQTDGSWTEKVLYAFQGTTDGSHPQSEGVVMDKAGSLYGGAEGTNNMIGGTIFKLSPSSSDWTFDVLFTFDYSDGALAAVSGFDPDGNLWGNAEILWELTPTGSGWAYNEVGLGFAGPTFVSAKKAYGTHTTGGPKTPNCPNGCGSVAQMYRNSEGVWKQSVLYRFKGGSDGNFPWATVIVGPQGQLYGTTFAGGGAPYGGDGTVFELAHGSDGKWTEQVILAFNGANGSAPWAAPIIDGSGNLYGTTFGGGTEGWGTVFELSYASGAWTETVLHNFSVPDGISPTGSLTRDSAGNLYGTLLGGGAYNDGAVFELSPVN